MKLLAFIGFTVVTCLVGNARAQLGSIMPTGDSITEGDYSSDWLGFRRPLYELLVAQGFEFSFVGDTAGAAGDERYMGHFRGGSKIEEFYPPGFGHGWGTGSFDIGPVLRDLHPDILLIHLGTNNMPQQTTPLGPYSFDGGATLHESYAGYMAELLMYIVAQYDGYSSETPQIVLSLILPMRDIVDRVVQYNDYLEELAIDMAYGQVTGAPVHVVICDHFTPFIENPLLFTEEPGDYSFDGVHPNDLGYYVMAETYLRALLDETPPAAVTDLTVWGQGAHSVKLWWTAPGDDNLSGTASTAMFRFFGVPIDDEELFSQAWELVPSVESNPGGTIQQLISGGLAGGGDYWIAMKVVDDAGNVSEVSNSSRVQIALADSLIDDFDEDPLPSMWELGGHYQVDSGMLKPVNPQPAWLPPAMFVGEDSPWEIELELPVVCPPGETNLAGLVVAADTPDQITDGFVVFCENGIVQLRSLDSGALGAVIDTATSSYGQFEPGDRLGVLPFVLNGKLLLRVFRNGMPDRILDANEQVFQIPAPRYAGVIMRGGLGWGIERFRLGGPGLLEPPEPFHLLSPDSGTTVEYSPFLVWAQGVDPDPWDTLRYTVLWSNDPEFPEGETTEMPCGADTFCSFPSEDFTQGEVYYWMVRAVDSTELETLSIERDWWFHASTNHSPLPFALIYPALGESVTTTIPVLLWNRSVDPDSGDEVTYSIRVSTEPDLTHPLVFQEGLLDTILQIGPLESVGPWFWSVEAKDDLGATAYADTSYFSLSSNHSAGVMPTSVVLGSPFPNPSTKEIRLSIETSEGSTILAELFDLGGRVVASHEVRINATHDMLKWTLPSGLADGSYLLRITTETKQATFPLLIRK